MPQYEVTYTSVADAFERLRGLIWSRRDHVFANDREELESIFARLGRHVISAEVYSPHARKLQRTRVAPRALLSYLSQLTLMLGNEKSIIEATSFLAAQLANSSTATRTLASGLADLVTTRGPEEAFKAFPRCFPRTVTGMITAGLRVGKLPDAMEKARFYVERSIAIQSAVARATLYPKIVAAFSLVVAGVMLGYVIPLFASIFGEMGVRLPAITLAMLDLSNFVASNSGAIAIMLLAGVVLYFHGRKVRTIDLFCDWACLRLPLVGAAIRSVEQSRVAASIAGLTEAGENLQSAITIAQDIPQNQFYRDNLAKIRAAMNHLPPAEAFRDVGTGYFDPEFASQLSVGIETGSVDRAAQQLSDYYDRDAQDRIDRLLQAMGPLLIIVMGVSVGVLVVAMLIPILTGAFQISS